MPVVVPPRLWMVVILTDEDAQVSMAISPAHAHDLAKVTIAVSGSGMSRASCDLDLVGSTWQGTLGPLPAGSDRTFIGSAFDRAGVVIFQGTATRVTTENTAVAMLILQQVESTLPDRHSETAEQSVV